MITQIHKVILGKKQKYMKSLYETILTSTNSGLHATIWNKTKPVIDSVLNSSSEFPVGWFLEGNNIRLDKDTAKKDS